MLDVPHLLSTTPALQTSRLDPLIVWLATYALHSTLLLGAAWLSSRFFPHAAERLWRLALLGGVATATLHSAGHLPRVVELTVAGLPSGPSAEATRGGSATVLASFDELSARPAADAPTTQAAQRRATGVSPQVEPRSDALLSHPSSLPTPDNGLSPTESAAQRRSARTATLLWRAAALAWIVSAAATLVVLAVRTLLFAWPLVNREPIIGGEAKDVLRELTRRAGWRRRLRLSVSPAARVPMARGWLRPEICLPRQTRRQLAGEELEAALAHELAHLERHDPLWRALQRLVASTFAFQPLNHLACRTLEDEAELRCDDRAAELTGRPAALARCLTRVAAWTAGERPAAAPALAASGGALRRRVLRLLEQRPSRPAPRWTQGVALLPLALVLAFAPGLSAAPPDPASDPSAGDTDGRRPAPTTLVAPPSRQRFEQPGALKPSPPIVHVLSLPTFGAVLPPPAPAVPALPPDPPEPSAPTPPVEPAGSVDPALSPVPPTAPVAPAGSVEVPVAPAPPAPVEPPGAVAPPAAPAPRAPVSPALPPAAHAPSALPSHAVQQTPRTAGTQRDTEPRQRVDSDRDREHEADDDAERAAEAAEEAAELASEQAEAAAEAAADAAAEATADVEARLEAAIEATVAAIEETLEQEIERFEDSVDAELGAFEDEVEQALLPLEGALESLSEELEVALESGDHDRVGRIGAEMGRLGSAMGELGSRVGTMVNEAGLEAVGERVDEMVSERVQAMEELIETQVELAERLVREIEDRRRRGVPLEDEATRALEAELDRLAAATASRRAELERLHPLGSELAPLRERIEALDDELRIEIEEWRRRHEALLREVEERAARGGAI